MKKITFVAILFILGCGTATKLVAPASEQVAEMQAKVPGITLEEANQGYVLYKAKCAGCHRLHHPSEFTVAQWDKILVTMFPKSKMTNETEKKLLRNYLAAFSK
jgi:hypothetical protein